MNGNKITIHVKSWLDSLIGMRMRLDLMCDRPPCYWDSYANRNRIYYKHIYMYAYIRLMCRDGSERNCPRSACTWYWYTCLYHIYIYIFIQYWSKREQHRTEYRVKIYKTKCSLRAVLYVQRLLPSGQTLPSLSFSCSLSAAVMLPSAFIYCPQPTRFDDNVHPEINIARSTFLSSIRIRHALFFITFNNPVLWILII